MLLALCWTPPALATIPRSFVVPCRQASNPNGAEWNYRHGARGRLDAGNPEATPADAAPTHAADGNRVSKTASGVTTPYLVDNQNPSGYAQVMEERPAASRDPTVAYVYGLALVSQKRGSAVKYYGTDGLGSVGYLTDANSAVTDTYTQDAFGISIAKTGTTLNDYRYTGQQWDGDLGMYYLRARYYKPDTGRFWTMDSFEGAGGEPLSLHKYLYSRGNPANMGDPSGHDGEFASALTAVSIAVNLSSAYHNIRQGSYAWAAVDILSAGFALGGLGGPGALGQLASAANLGRGLTFAQWATAVRGAQRVSQSVAGLDIVMMAMSGTSSRATLGPSSAGGDASELYENRMPDQYNAELAKAGARGVQSISVNSLEQLKGLLEQNPVLKSVVTSDRKLRIVPKRAGNTESGYALDAC